MKTDTREKIFRFIEERNSARPNDLIEHFKITAAAIHRHLLRLQKDHMIEKVGSAPHVRYRSLRKFEIGSKVAKPIAIPEADSNEPAISLSLSQPPTYFCNKKDMDFLD